MKQIITCLWIIAATSSCLKGDEESSDPKNMTVAQYISLLKSDEYTHAEIPAFSIDDIPELLLESGNNQMIQNYPYNPISSLALGSGIEIGFVILWTIESVRLDVAYPSLNPIVRDGDTARNVSLDEVAEWYQKWWKEHGHKNESGLRKILPFDGTELWWH